MNNTKYYNVFFELRQQKINFNFYEPKNLNKTQQKIVDIVLKNPKVTQSEIAEQLNISISAVKKSMKEIVKAGVLVRIGANKGGYWKVVEKV